MHSLIFIEGQELVIFLIPSGLGIQGTAADYRTDSLSYETNALIHFFFPTSQHALCSNMQFPAPQTSPAYLE